MNAPALEYACAASAGADLAATLVAMLRPAWLQNRPPFYAVALMLVGFALSRTLPAWAAYASAFALAGAAIVVVTARGALLFALFGPFALAIASLAIATYLSPETAAAFRQTSAILLALPGPLVAAIVFVRGIGRAASRRSQT